MLFRMGEPSAADFDEYAARFPSDVRRRLRQVRQAVRKAAPGAVESIAYGMPSFRLGSGRVSFGAFAQHVGFYPGAAAVAAFSEELSTFESAKGSVRFPFDRPLPLALIARITPFRMGGRPNGRSTT